MIAIRRFFVFLRNLFWFVLLALWRGTPFRLWGVAWRRIEEKHRRDVGEMCDELVRQGKVKRVLVNGRFRYYGKDATLPPGAAEYPPPNGS